MRTAIISLVVVFGAATASARVSDSEVNSRVHDLAKSTMSPFCPGKTLKSCTSRGASEWLDEMRGWVRQGASDDEIRSRLQARVPDFDISHDPGGSANWLLIALPVALVSLILLVVGRRFVGRVPTPPAEPQPIDPEVMAELEAALDDELASFD